MTYPPIRLIKKAVHAAGYHCRHDALGFYICTDAEGAREDEGHASAGFDGRPHYWTLNSAYRDAYLLHVKTVTA